jgi:uncharacterized protein YlxW (UPF0749 family)
MAEEKSPEQLQAENQKLQKENKELKEALDKTKNDSSVIVKDLQKRLQDKVAAGKNGFGSVEVGGKNFRIALPAIELNGETFTADEVAADKDLQKELVELGSGMLVNVAAEKAAKEKAAKKAEAAKKSAEK